MAAAVRRAVAADRDAVVRTLARAFVEEPVLDYFVRKDDKRPRAIETIFDISFRHLTLPFDETWITEDGAGVALWTPPGRWSILGAISSIPGLIFATGGILTALEKLGSMNRMQARHPKTPPHYYLFALGVDPEQQGRGHGSALLRAVTSRCDEMGIGAYLETSTDVNVRIYTRHGFRVTEELKMAKDAPIVRLMWREPQPRG